MATKVKVLSLILVVVLIFSIMYSAMTSLGRQSTSPLHRFTRSSFWQLPRGPENVTEYLQDMRYKTFNQSAQLRFNIDRTLLTKLGFPITNFSIVDADDFVFVAASSANHFHQATDAIAQLQIMFPTKTIYFYHLDSSEGSRANTMRQLCNVVYRQFNYSRYPKHVRRLYTYAFKPLLMHELLQEHSNVFWIDASIRFRTGNLKAVINQTINEGGGLMTFDNAGGSNFHATHALMYRYLPIAKDDAVRTTMRGASAIFIRSNKQLYDYVLRWWFLCALVQNCIAPTRDLYCRFRNRRAYYAGCHRYDQSALNILSVNYFNTDQPFFSRYGVISNSRGSHGRYKLLVCGNKTRLEGNVTRIRSTSI